MSGAYFLGVDLGGTLVRMAAITPDGRLAGEVVSTPTGRDFGPSDLERELRGLTDRVISRLNGHVIAGLGLGAPGVVGQGPLSQCVNLPRLNGVDLDDLVRRAAPYPVSLENDARCFTLAEARYGAGRGARHVCGLTLGTGLGCGLLIDGRLHRGQDGQAGEVWRIPWHGRPLEDSLSGGGVVRGYEAAGGRSEPGLDAVALAERARQGDPAAIAAWEGFGGDLAFLCQCVIAFVDPAVIVIGGSLSRARDLFRPALEARLEGESARIVDPALGAAAGVIGAAALNIP